MSRQTLTGGPRLRLPAHRASSATLAGAYPFLFAPSLSTGTLVGTDALSGAPFCFDPWDLYGDGVVTNANVLLAGGISEGKSALAKTLALRSIGAGRRVYVPGDPKGEWALVAHAVGGIVLQLGPGLPTRLNPLDTLAGDPPIVHAHRLRLLVALAATALRRDLTAAEHTVLDTALSAAAQTASARDASPTIPDVITALDARHGDRADGRDLGHGLGRLVRGELAGMFDGPSTYRLDLHAPMAVLDLSALGNDDHGLELAMTCASAWLDAALTTAPNLHGAAPRRWVIYDEAWRLLRFVALIRRMQLQWKLSRAYGIANLMILHRLSDLDAVGAAGSEARALAGGLLADCATRIVYRQESDQLAATATTLGLTGPERELLAALPRGVGLWKMPSRSHVVRHHLHVDELPLVDTDAAMRGEPEHRPLEVAP